MYVVPQIVSCVSCCLPKVNYVHTNFKPVDPLDFKMNSNLVEVRVRVRADSLILRQGFDPPYQDHNS